jgi:hypothetical protein
MLITQLRNLEKSGKSRHSEGKIAIPIDFPSGLSALLRISAPVCRWQLSGRNDIENHKTLSTARNAQYSPRNTNNERRLTEIF